MKGTKTIRVTHPLYGTYVAKGVRDKLQAVQAAAREWKLQWSKIARECSFEEDTSSTASGPPSPQGEGKDPSLRSG